MSNDFSDPPTIGYVLYDADQYVTVCTDCHDLRIGAERSDVIRDNGVYGDRVAYPECYDCGEVIRP